MMRKKEDEIKEVINRLEKLLSEARDIVRRYHQSVVKTLLEDD